jgi:hypothetical protein
MRKAGQDSPSSAEMTPSSWQSAFFSAARYWEKRRPLYNLFLAAVTIFWVVLSWPHFRPAMNPGNLFRLLGLALIANVCYCAAYLVDLPLQLSALSGSWSRGRWTLWLIGTAFAMLLTSYWINDEIYPFVR